MLRSGISIAGPTTEIGSVARRSRTSSLGFSIGRPTRKRRMVACCMLSKYD